MSETLTHVKESIASCERAKNQNLEYYNIYWRDQHEVLLRVEKELEEYIKMLDEGTEAHYKKVEDLTKTGLNFYDALATVREKENK